MTTLALSGAASKPHRSKYTLGCFMLVSLKGGSLWKVQ
jgi:hypothetical protein